MSLTIDSFLPHMLVLLSACLSTYPGPLSGGRCCSLSAPPWLRLLDSLEMWAREGAGLPGLAGQRECAFVWTDAFGRRSSLAEGHADPHPRMIFGG